MKVPDALKRFRKEFGLSQDAVAKEIGIARQSYSFYESETNDGTFPAKFLIALMKRYNVSADYLLGLSDNPKTAAEIADENKVLADAAMACYQTVYDTLIAKGLKRQ